MDTELLVDQEAGGRTLIEQLTRDAFRVTAALWVRTSDDGPWHLYIASPQVDEDKSIDAYRKLYVSLNRTPSSWVSPSDVKLVNDQNPIARAAIEVRDRRPTSFPTMYQSKRLGDLGIKEACIYPETAPRLRFTVTYYRNGDTNNWKATIKRGPLYRGTTAKGAVSYATASREGETEPDQRFAIVGVLVAIDPTVDNPDILDSPDLKKITANQAREMADVKFRSYHPDAIIEHEEDEES